MDKQKELISDTLSCQNATARQAPWGRAEVKRRECVFTVSFSAPPLVPRDLDCCIRKQESRTLSDKSCIQCGSKEIWGF